MTSEMVDLIASLREAASEIEGWGAGNEAKVVRKAADALTALAKAFPEPRELLIATLKAAGGLHNPDENAPVVADAILAALASPILAGWRLVPVEPTLAMKKAAFEVCEIAPGASGFATGTDARNGIYRAMLAAAPSPGDDA